MATTHKVRVLLQRKGLEEPTDGGMVEFIGRDYETFDEAEALLALLPGGDGPENLDLSLQGFVRWRGILLPASDFQGLEVKLVSKSR